MKYSVRTVLSMTCLASAIVLSGCSSSSSSDDSNSHDNGSSDNTTVTTVDDANLSLLDADTLVELEGIWEQRGYGNLYEYADDRTTWYALTENNCLEVTTFPGLAGISTDEVEQTRYKLSGDQLALAFPDAVYLTRLDRLDSLPARCEDVVARDAQGTFDYVWETFDEYYAFFEERGVDWAAEYARQLPRVGEATDDAALFGLLSDLLSPIDDGHVFIQSNDDGYSPAVERGINLEFERGFAAQSEVADFGDWANGVFDEFTDVIESLLDEGSTDDQGQFAWGTADGGSTGYMVIFGMQGYVLDENGDPMDASLSDEVEAADAMMDLVMEELADTSRLIIDLRFNGGGFDAISFNFAQRFISERQLAFSKSARSRDYQSVPVEAWLEPLATGAYLNPVTLIVGANTASAAEIFAIPMSQLPQVTVIGERTAGILSDILQKPLPNGWLMGLSNEVYLDAQGVSFEGVGLIPEIEVPVFQVDDIQAGVDQALELALGL